MKTSASQTQPTAPVPLLQRLRTNPLDWPHVDKTLLLAALTLLTPLGIGAAVLIGLRFAPSWFDSGWTAVTLCILGAQMALTFGILIAGVQIRQKRTEAPALETCTVFSYQLTLAAVSWLSGTYLTIGLILHFLALALLLPLGDIHKARKAYRNLVVILAVMIAIGATGQLEHAPMFERPLSDDQGKPYLVWHIFLAGFALATSALFIITFSVTDRWLRREDELRGIASTDGLTGLTNRRYTVLRGEAEFSRASRVQDYEFSCILMDIDHFKSVNDTYGHDTGDAALISVADTLKHLARDSDETGRYGGEEFLLILPNCNLDAAKQIAERIRQRIEATPVEHDSQRIKITASFGLASTATHPTSFSDMVKSADLALYKAKENGRNRVEQ